jgi:LysM repeat protein
MIVDQLFTPKPLEEGGPYDLPGKDYARPGDTPRKRPSGEHNPYPYSKEEDDDHFREIFRKKREAAAKASGHKSLSEALELYFGKNSKPISEGNRNDQLRLMEETTFRNGYAFARLLVEKNLTKDQVLQLFKDVEQEATAAGGNRTGLGKAKDATTQAIGSVQKMLSGARKWVKERPTYQAVDAEYNRAMTALGKVGGESGEANAVAKAIYKYRDIAKKYPRATGLAKWAIISAAGFLTGGLGGVGVSAGLAAIDSALKDNEIIDIVKDAGYAAAVGGAIQGAGQLASMASDAYYGMPSASEIAANNAALGDWNDTDLPGGPANNINGLDLPPDQVSGLTADGDPNIVGPGVEALSPEEAAKAAAQAKAYGFDGDVTLDQLNQAIMQTAEPGTVPADYSQLGAGADTGGSTYTVTADDVKGLGKIAQDNGLTAKQLWDANPQITDPDKIFVGQEINMPAASGEPVQNVWQDWDGPTKPTAPAVEPGPGDDVPTLSNPAGGKIDYTAPGPESTDSLGQKLEYGIPVNDKGSFVPPNSGLPAEELAKQTAAYNSWLADFMKRFPNATPGPDGSMLTFKPGLAPMYPGMTPKAFESVKFKIIPAEQLIDQKLTVLSWALNESVNRKGHQSVHLTPKGVRTVFENIGRCRRAYLKEYIGAPTTDYGHPTAAGAPASATAGQGKPQGWFGKTLDTIGRGVDKVGSYVSNVGHNVITKVTADKLNNMWNRAGEPYDSDRLYQLLTTEWGVPKQVVDSVFSKMSIPYTAPATAQPAGQSASPAVSGKAEREMWGGSLLKDPDTGKSYTVDKIQRGLSPAASATNTAATNPDVAAAYNASLKAGKPASIPKLTTTPKSMGARRTNVKKPTAPIAPTATNITSTYGPGLKNSNQPAVPKEDPQAETKKAIAARRAAGLSAYESKTNGSRIFQALKRPVTEMLQMVETKEDVQRIKQFVDDTFIKYGAVNESAFAVRNRIIEHVTQTGAQRRREHSQRVAH